MSNDLSEAQKLFIAKFKQLQQLANEISELWEIEGSHVEEVIDYISYNESQLRSFDEVACQLNTITFLED